METRRKFSAKRAVQELALLFALPDVIKGRILTMGAISIGILLFGGFAGWYLSDDSMTAFSVILAILLLLRTVMLFYMIRQSGYEAVAGKVTDIRGQRTPGRMMTVELMTNDAQSTQICVSKQRLARGKTYRFYFLKEQKMMPGEGKIGVAAGIGSYLGHEEI